MADEAAQDATTEVVEQQNETVAGESTADDGQQDKEIDWKARFEAQQKVSRDLEKKVKGEAGTLRSELAELKAKAEGREAEFAAEQERRKVESEALAKADERILKAEIRAAAAAKLADPADALRFLDLDQFEVGNDGEVDASAITEALEALVKSKPYLAAQGGTTGTVFESAAAHRKGEPVKQLTQSELKDMSPAQITAARAEGRLNDLLGIKS